MATTITISQTLNWCYAYVVGRPTQGVGGFSNEPGLTNANYIMASVLTAPFKWEWNRNSTTFTTTAGTTDYQEAISDFGYLEKATVYNASNTPTTAELEVYKVIAQDTEQSSPRRIAILLDDNNGNITFRLFPCPDDTYTVTLTYQKAPITATTLGVTTWAPIPDKLAFIYEQGMRAQLTLMYNQQAGLAHLEVFFRQLVGACEGLTEAEKDIYLTDALRPIRQRQAELMATQQGRQARQ